MKAPKKHRIPVIEAFRSEDGSGLIVRECPACKETHYHSCMYGSIEKYGPRPVPCDPERQYNLWVRKIHVTSGDDCCA